MSPNGPSPYRPLHGALVLLLLSAPHPTQSRTRVLDDAAVVAGDFRIDPAGHLRFSVTISPQTGQRRIGRVVQRLEVLVEPFLRRFVVVRGN